MYLYHRKRTDLSALQDRELEEGTGHRLQLAKSFLTFSEVVHRVSGPGTVVNFLNSVLCCL